jgi:hypothetical protein
MSEALAEEKGYRLVRGWYHEPMWKKKQPHWWCMDDQGNIHDSTVKQFPSGGIREFYEEFAGVFVCQECGKEFREENGYRGGTPYPVCSSECYGKMVGLL